MLFRTNFALLFVGTEDNVKVAELLMKAWAVMEPNAEQIGLQLFRSVFIISTLFYLEVVLVI